MFFVIFVSFVFQHAVALTATDPTKAINDPACGPMHGCAVLPACALPLVLIFTTLSRRFGPEA